MKHSVNSVQCESRPVTSDSLQPHGLYSPWNSPGQNTGVGSLSLLQRIFPTQGSNPGLPLTSRSVEQYISVVSTHPICGTLLQKSQEINIGVKYPAFEWYIKTCYWFLTFGSTSSISLSSLTRSNDLSVGSVNISRYPGLVSDSNQNIAKVSSLNVIFFVCYQEISRQ